MAYGLKASSCNTLIIKGAQSYLYNYFSSFLRFWYHKKTHIFLKTHGKFHSWIVFCSEDTSENVPGYGKHKLH